MADRPNTWRIMIAGEKVRITAASAADARAKAYRLQDEARERAEQWPAVRERLLNPPDLATIESAIESPFEVSTIVGAWQSIVAEKVGLSRDDVLAGLTRPRRINLDVLAAAEDRWRIRSREVAAERAIRIASVVPLTVAAAVQALSAALRLRREAPAADPADVQALSNLLTLLDEHVPDLVDAHVRQSGRSAVSLTREHPSVRQTMGRYLADYRGRIGLTEHGISAETYNAKSKGLHHALGLSAGDQETFAHAPPIDLDADLHSLGTSELRAVVRFWLDGKVKRRTALNRLRALASMLEWAGNDDRINYQWAVGSRKLFRFPARKGAARREARIDPYHRDTLAALMRSARPRTALYVLLSLNCGMLPRDIAKLRPEHLRTMEGRPYLVRLRSKEETSDEAYETAHVLWPETLALLQAERAPAANPHGLMLLTRAGTPLEVAAVDQWNKNPISKAFDRAVEAAKLRGDKHRPQLRQLRKMGASAVFRHANERAAAMYRGQAFEGSANLYITVSDWQPLTAALDRWADELRADGVLPSPAAGTAKGEQPHQPRTDAVPADAGRSPGEPSARGTATPD